jgi:hypothetical protein
MAVFILFKYFDGFDKTIFVGRQGRISFRHRFDKLDMVVLQGDAQVAQFFARDPNRAVQTENRYEVIVRCRFKFDEFNVVIRQQIKTIRAGFQPQIVQCHSVAIDTRPFFETGIVSSHILMPLLLIWVCCDETSIFRRMDSDF